MKYHLLILLLFSLSVVFLSCKTQLSINVIKSPPITLDTAYTIIIGDFISKNDSLQLDEKIQHSLFSIINGAKINGLLYLKDIKKNMTNPLENNDELYKLINKEYPKSLLLRGDVWEAENSYIIRGPVYGAKMLCSKLRVTFELIDTKNKNKIIEKEYSKRIDALGSPGALDEIMSTNIFDASFEFARYFMPSDTTIKLSFFSNSDIMGLETVVNCLKSKEIEKAEDLLRRIAIANYKSKKAKAQALFNYGIFLNYNGKSIEALDILNQANEMMPNKIEIIDAIKLVKRKLYRKVR